MVFTVRYILGVYLVLISSAAIHSAALHHRKVREATQLPIDQPTTLHPQPTTLKPQPKTENNVPSSSPTEENTTNLPNYIFEQDIKKQSEPRTENARSLDFDISKYTSAEFHNKNNVYNIPTSPENEKFVSEFTHKPSSEITTPRFQEYQDETFKAEHLENHETLDDLINKAKENNTARTNLNFVKYSNVISDSKADKSSVRKNFETEKGLQVEFDSVYNDTKFTNEEATEKPLGIKKVEGRTERTTRFRTKSPPFNRTIQQNYILSNKIELEFVKPTAASDLNKEVAFSRPQEDNVINIFKRGSTKYANTVNSGSTERLNKTNEIPLEVAKGNRSHEQSVEENNIYPVIVALPSVKSSTTLMYEMTDEKLDTTTEAMKRSDDLDYLDFTTEEEFYEMTESTTLSSLSSYYDTTEEMSTVGAVVVGDGDSGVAKEKVRSVEIGYDLSDDLEKVVSTTPNSDSKGNPAKDLVGKELSSLDYESITSDSSENVITTPRPLQKYSSHFEEYLYSLPPHFGERTTETGNKSSIAQLDVIENAPKFQISKNSVPKETSKVPEVISLDNVSDIPEVLEDVSSTPPLQMQTNLFDTQEMRSKEETRKFQNSRTLVPEETSDIPEMVTKENSAKSQNSRNLVPTDKSDVKSEENIPAAPEVISKVNALDTSEGTTTETYLLEEITNDSSSSQIGAEVSTVRIVAKDLSGKEEETSTYQVVTEKSSTANQNFSTTNLNVSTFSSQKSEHLPTTPRMVSNENMSTARHFGDQDTATTNIPQSTDVTHPVLEENLSKMSTSRHFEDQDTFSISQSDSTDVTSTPRQFGDHDKFSTIPPLESTHATPPEEEEKLSKISTLQPFGDKSSTVPQSDHPKEDSSTHQIVGVETVTIQTTDEPTTNIEDLATTNYFDSTTIPSANTSNTTTILEENHIRLHQNISKLDDEYSTTPNALIREETHKNISVLEDDFQTTTENRFHQNEEITTELTVDEDLTTTSYIDPSTPIITSGHKEDFATIETNTSTTDTNFTTVAPSRPNPIENDILKSNITNINSTDKNFIPADVDEDDEFGDEDYIELNNRKANQSSTDDILEPIDPLLVTTSKSGSTQGVTTAETTTISEEENEINTTEEVSSVDPDSDGGSGTVIAIVISSVGAVCLVVLAGLLFVMRRRQKRFNYGQRCTPVSLDAYSMDNVSVYNSVRRKAAMRGSKRSYGNPAFDDTSVSHPLSFQALVRFASNSEEIKSEYEDIPQVTARMNELPEGCDTKNRYANIIPLPETRVFLNPIEDDPTGDYINANYVTGPKGVRGYYIACQAPLQNTVDDFWRMIWEQQSKVVIMLTHLYENGVEKCVDYLPPSEVLDCHRLFGDYQVTLKKREVKDKYIISSLQLKNMVSNSWREVTHLWYSGWPEKGVPTEENSLIAFLIEARSFVKLVQNNLDVKFKETNGNVANAGNPEVSPVVVHCSPGTGRTGTVIACDIAIREFELKRVVDIPKVVYRIRRDRASSVQTKDQYAFIYKVINLYATKLTGGALDSI